MTGATVTFSNTEVIAGEGGEGGTGSTGQSGGGTPAIGTIPGVPFIDL
ncbi:MAG: hypothetical protein GY822_32340 [Deltaproteobacteria bacterium]|nr:hypothetical protein [Deltaproteobacteria bacterium]